MKRIVSLMLIALMIGAFAVVSIADVDPSYVVPYATEDFVPNKEGIDIGPDESDNSGGVLGATDSPLTPGEEYRYQLYYKGEEVTDETLKDYNFRISAKKGSGTMSSFSIVKRNGKQMLVAVVKAAWPTSLTDVQYEIRVVDRKTGATIQGQTKTIDFQTGYLEADDATIASLGQGDEIVVDPTRPVYTKDQLEKIASVNNYRNVTFVGDNWRYTTNISDMKAINMLFNYKGIKEVLSQYPDNDFEFVAFPAGPSFPINGKFELDVSDFADDYNNKFYVYRYLSGKLTQLTTTFDEDDNYLTFNTNTLGRFIVTDRAMDTSIIEGETDNNGGTGGTGGGTDTGRPNPGTGAVA